MGRTYSELLADLFRAGATVEYNKLTTAVARKDENLASRGLSQSTIRAQVITQMVVDSYEAVLTSVEKQLEIPAESIGIRTQDDANQFLTHFDCEAEACRNRWKIKRNKMLANVGVNWQGGDEYEEKTMSLKNRSMTSVKLRVAATLSPEAKAREDAWKLVHQVVEGQMASRAHDIEEKTRRDVYALGKRRPVPREAYDSDYIAGMWMKGLRERVEIIFSVYPEAVKELAVDVDGIESVIRTHVNVLLEEAVADYRRIVGEEFEKWNNQEVPQNIVDKAVAAARASVIGQTELMLVAVEKPSPDEENQRLVGGDVAHLRDVPAKSMVFPTGPTPSAQGVPVSQGRGQVQKSV